MTGQVIKFSIGRVERQHRIRRAMGVTAEAEAIDEARMSVRHAIKSLQRQVSGGLRSTLIVYPPSRRDALGSDGDRLHRGRRDRLLTAMRVVPSEAHLLLTSCVLRVQRTPWVTLAQ